MGSDEDSVKEQLLPSNISKTNPSESESPLRTSVKMHSAIIKNEKESESGRKEKDEDDEGDLSLHDAVCGDEIDEVEDLVATKPQLVFERDFEGKTPLHTLAYIGNEQAVEFAKILLGVNESDEDSSLTSIDRPNILNLLDNDNSTPLHYASRGRQGDLVSAFLRWGANAGIKDGHGNLPLHLVAEGNTEKALEVATILMSHDGKKTLINSVNNQDHTPLHMAIGKKALKMVNFLLTAENKCDLSVKNSLGRTALHYACSASGESESSCEIVKSLLKRSTQTQINQTDCRGRTVLHLAAITRFPKIVKLLVEDERMDVLKTDDKGRTALHYAAEDGCYTKGYQCVEALIERKFEKYTEQVKYLFKIEDTVQKATAFMYASVNCPPQTMQKYVDLCPTPRHWLSSMYMTLLYKNSPLALKPLMDRAFSEDQSNTHEGEDGINTDFGLITGYVDPVEVMPQQETKYLKQSQWWNYESQKEILLHPLVQFFVVKKWQKLRCIISFWILWQLIWLAAYTSVGLSFYTNGTNKTETAPVGGGSASPPQLEDISGTKALALLGSVVMLVYLVGSVINECFEMFTIGTAYILSLTNALQLLQCILGFIAIYPVLTGYHEPENWMKYTTATGVLLAYILSLRDIGKLHSDVGLIVEVLKQVLIQILQVLVCCAPLWIGFTIAFIIIFDDEESLSSSFPGPIVKVLVMMTGEFEYNDTFKDGSTTNPASAWIRVIRLIFFLAFLISVPVGFFNLLTGFALDKVMELRERAKVQRMAKKLEHIYFVESILLSIRPLRKIFSHASIVSFLRRLNVTSQWFNTETGPELKFETLIKEKIRKSNRNFKHSSGFANKLCHGPFQFCQTGGLSQEVTAEIYKLASPSTSTSS